MGVRDPQRHSNWSVINSEVERICLDGFITQRRDLYSKAVSFKLQFKSIYSK